MATSSMAHVEPITTQAHLNVFVSIVFTLSLSLFIRNIFMYVINNYVILVMIKCSTSHSWRSRRKTLPFKMDYLFKSLYDQRENRCASPGQPM